VRRVVHRQTGCGHGCGPFRARPALIHAGATDSPTRKPLMAGPFLWLFGAIVQLIIIVLIVNAVISWLVAFDIVSRRNAFVAQIWDFTQRLTDPLLKPLRRIIPPIGGMDLSPIVLILGLLFLVRLLYAVVPLSWQ